MNPEHLVHHWGRPSNGHRATCWTPASSHEPPDAKWFGIFLLLLFVLALEAYNAKTGIRSGIPAAVDGSSSAPDLDSFSEPALAAAILKKHAQLLQEACADALGQWADAPGDHTSQWIDRYQAELHRAKDVDYPANVEHGLLLLYKASNRRLEFVECYLSLLGGSPDRPVLWRWAGDALSCAQSCGRTEELLDALGHVARFHQDPDFANHMQAALEKWLAANPQFSSLQRR